ncbi:permease-like cell division protein FtsX [Patescibacteria group bacterium]|nr:permease-like cell division protein FtsX [Patescibacteria group bacterium]
MNLNLKKIFKFGTQNFARNFWLKILTITILAVLLLLINGLFIIDFLTKEASKQMESKVDISIYLKPGTADEEAKSLRSYLSGLPSVSSVVYTGPDDVLGQFKEKHKNDKTILSSLDFLDQNPFGGILVVQTLKIEDYKTVLKQLENPIYTKIIENKDFSDQEKLVGAINKLTGFVNQVIIVISLFFAFIAAVVIFNTIRISIDSHRHEIGIMRLVGASNWFIRGQFLVSDVLFCSVLATILAFILIFPIIATIQPSASQFFNNQAGDIFRFYRSHFLSLFSVQFLGVFAFSLLSASFAMGRYLKK